VLLIAVTVTSIHLEILQIHFLFSVASLLQAAVMTFVLLLLHCISCDPFISLKSMEMLVRIKDINLSAAV
jgi:hypothetical protein